MIGEGLYIGITRYMEKFLTEKAVNGMVCQYDVWTNVSPLWLGKCWIILVIEIFVKTQSDSINVNNEKMYIQYEPITL